MLQSQVRKELRVTDDNSNPATQQQIINNLYDITVESAALTYGYSISTTNGGRSSIRSRTLIQKAKLLAETKQKLVTNLEFQQMIKSVT